MTSDSSPKTEAAFAELMERIDAQMRADGVPILYRPLKAQSLLAVLLDERFVHPCPKRPPADGVFTGDDLTIRVERWCDARYGARLAMSFGPGKAVILLRGDPWVLNLPLAVGRFEFVASRSVIPFKSGSVPPNAPPSRINVVEWIEHLTPDLRSALTDSELADIRGTAYLALTTLEELRSLTDIKLVWETLSDHAACVRHIVEPPAHFGQAKWSAMQATEKILKAFIASRGDTFRPDHDLQHHARQCISLGLGVLDPLIVAKAECKPGVRYGSPTVTVAEAVEAHHAALSVCTTVAHWLLFERRRQTSHSV